MMDVERLRKDNEDCLCLYFFDMNEDIFDHILEAYLKVRRMSEDFFRLIRRESERLPIAALILLTIFIYPKYLGDVIKYHLGFEDVDYLKIDKKIRRIMSKDILISGLSLKKIYDYELWELE